MPTTAILVSSLLMRLPSRFRLDDPAGANDRSALISKTMTLGREEMSKRLSASEEAAFAAQCLKMARERPPSDLDRIGTQPDGRPLPAWVSFGERGLTESSLSTHYVQHVNTMTIAAVEDAAGWLNDLAIAPAT